MLTVRQLDRWETFWHLCGLGCCDVAITLAVRVLREQFATSINAVRTVLEWR